MDGGRLTAAGGRIELGSVAGTGNVSLTQSGNTIRLGYDAIPNFGTLLLSNQAIVDASGSGGGHIQIRGQRFEMTQNSNLRADTLGAQDSGTVSVRVTEVDLSESSLLTADVAATGTGTGGNLTIAAQRFTVRGGAQVSNSTFGRGQGGNSQVTASDAIALIGTSPDGTLSGLFAESNSSGNAGDLKIDTPRLQVQGGAGVSVNTFGRGRGGNLQITAPDAVEVSDRSPDGQRPSGLSAQSFGRGDAGNLQINTGRLLIQGGAGVFASTFSRGKGGRLQITTTDSVEVIGLSPDGQRPSSLSAQSNFGSGDAGDLIIDTKRLRVSDGAQVTVGTFGNGKSGRLQITASDSIDLIGTDGVLLSGLFTQSNGSRDAGDLTVNTGRLQMQGGAVISSGSDGQGRAGNLTITARDTLRVENGTIGTASAQTQGGAITITAGKIRLFDNSNIISNVASGADNGGKITLTANSILAFNDSDILAFARNGRGGDITLNTPAFFGENYRPAPSGINPDSLDNNNRVDINATGAISGIITTPDVSFIQNSLTELPDNQINTDTLLASSCIVRRAQSTQGSFTITGTGGLPQRPGEAQTSSFPTVTIETLPNSTLPPAWRKGDPILEPQGVYRLPNGKLVLSRNCL